ncbi:STAS domain-containing protein [Nocardioides sp. YIM 152315]|uniref:STAS domain-containing protein n=1 Tax=Nocardioides sp. YIM 152315 TaxID=3031760 RepID=UPI0023DBB48B|nr:STAS domain-containing protein [Nocardioides sp. YIM 152315]MDF1604015.1 STAS domain-containing protein [Nocardioides sp. YIM 152315]
MTDTQTVEPPFEVGITHVPGHTVVEISGDLDVFTGARLRQVLFDPVLCSEPHVVVDLAGVTFIDSTGLGTLVAARRWLTSRDAGISLVCGQGPALRLLEMVCLDKVFEIHESVPAATGRA